MRNRLATTLSRWLAEAVDDIARGTLKAFTLFGCLLVATCSAAPAYAQSIFGNGFESGSPGGEPPPDFCSDPAVNPSGWNPEYDSWTGAFSAWDGHPSAIYPGAVSYPVAIGAARQGYKVVPFTPYAMQSVNLYWDQVQSRPQDGYPFTRFADGMFVGITDCSRTFGQITIGSGDLRPPVQAALDQTQRPGCRRFEGTASLIWTTDPGVATSSNDYVCVLTPGKRYYLLFSPTDVRDGLTIGEHSCLDHPNTQNGCDVGVVTQVSGGPAQARQWIVRKAFGLSTAPAR